jgi:hypothetical protein
VSPGVESPVTEVSFGGAASLHVVGRVGTGPAVSASGGKASLPIQGTDTFQFIAGTDGVHQVLVEGAVQLARVGNPTRPAAATARRLSFTRDTRTLGARRDSLRTPAHHVAIRRHRRCGGYVAGYRFSRKAAVNGYGGATAASRPKR